MADEISLEGTVRTSLSERPARFDRPTDLIVHDGEHMSPSRRKPEDHEGQVTGWGWRFPGYFWIEMLAELRKVNPLWILTVALSVCVGTAAYPAATHSGDYADAVVESKKLDNRQREEVIEDTRALRVIVQKQAETIEGLVKESELRAANEQARETRDRVLNERMLEIIERFDKANNR